MRLYKQIFVLFYETSKLRLTLLTETGAHSHIIYVD